MRRVYGATPALIAGIVTCLALGSAGVLRSAASFDERVDLLKDRACEQNCAERIAQWCEPATSEGVAPNCYDLGEEQIIETCKRCVAIERCRGTEEANRCYGGGPGGPPWLKPEVSGYYGSSESAKDLWLLELETPVTVCFSFTTSAQTEKFSGLGTAGLFGAVSETGSAALSVLASEAQPSVVQGARGSDEISLGALGVGAKVYLYRGFFASFGVDSYFELEGAREISDLAYRLGVGYQRLINARLSVRGEVRYRFFDELDLDGASAMVGIGIRFGKKKPPRKLVIPSPQVD